MGVRRNVVIAAVVSAIACAGMRGVMGASIDEIKGDTLPKGGMWMETMEIGLIDQGFSRPRAKQSVDRKAITLHGDVFKHGVGSHAPGEVRMKLDGAATRFVSAVGIDDETGGKGSGESDGNRRWEEGGGDGGSEGRRGAGTSGCRFERGEGDGD